MTFTETLMADAYPAYLIELWAGRDGWPCYKTALCTKATEPAYRDHVEYETYRLAHDAAVSHGKLIYPDGCAIIDMTKEPLGA